MKKVKVIKNIPARLPIFSTLVILALFDLYNVSDIWWGIMGTLLAVYWVLCIIIVFFAQEDVDIKLLLEVADRLNKEAEEKQKSDKSNEQNK